MAATRHVTESGKTFRYYLAWNFGEGQRVDVLYPQLLALVVIALMMVSISAWHFRKQLGYRHTTTSRGALANSCELGLILD